MVLDERNRYKSIDIARGIAILCIIIGHLESETINRMVFTFDVPLFFVITGYFLSENTSCSEFIKRKFRTLIVPYACTCLVMIGLGALKGWITGGMGEAVKGFLAWTYASLYGAGDSYTEPFCIRSIGAIWFLWATFWGSILLKISLKCRQECRPFLVLLLFLMGYYSRLLFWFPFSIQAGCCAVLFLYAGYICKKSKAVIAKIPDETKIAVTLFALLVWLSFIKDFQSFWLVHCDIGRGIVDIFGCLCGCCLVFLISRFIEKYFTALGRGLAFIGKYSIFMLCMHIIELSFFPWWQLAGKMTELGIPGALRLTLVVAGKFIMDIGVTILCVHCRPVRNLFGMK